MAGMDSHVFRPMITALRAPGSSTRDVTALKYAMSLGRRQGRAPSRPMPISSFVAATTIWNARDVMVRESARGWAEPECARG